MLRRAWLLSLTLCSGYETRSGDETKWVTQSRSGYETKWFTQSLTHVRGDSRTFAQRYLVESYVGRGTAPLPGAAHCRLRGVGCGAAPPHGHRRC